MIEKNIEFCNKFQSFLTQKYKMLINDCKIKVPLSSLVNRTGKLLKNNEWNDKIVMDLSTMPENSIIINNFSNGSDFKTNIKTVDNLDLVYGSIRPYFKKCGFVLDVNYIVGSVFSFKPVYPEEYLWLLACICSEDFHKYTNTNSQGTKMPMINWETFIEYKVPYDPKIASDFNRELNVLFNIVKKKCRETRKLKKIKEIMLKKYF